MPDKKKMTVAEILAAARKADQGDSPAPSEPQASADAGSAERATDADAPPAGQGAGEAKPSGAAPAAKIPKPGTGGRPDVSSILAMARSSKGGAEGAGGGDGSQAGAKGSPKADKGAPADKPVKSDKPGASEKPGASQKPAKADKPDKPSKGAAAAATPVRDTASILAAARKKERPGPLSKAEAAAKSAAPSAPAKLAAPPMPAKPAYARPKGQLTGALAKEAGATPVSKSASVKGGVGKAAAADADRRDFLSLGFGLLAATLGAWTFVTVKFMFPNVLREPPSKFKVGFPDAFPLGLVETKYIAQFGVWIVSTEYDGKPQLFALKSVCTHLGCTPNWLEAEQKFKCPCHGSGFYKDGINFEGPAPRPLERYAIRLADDGQVEIDKSRTFQEEMGQWADPTCYIPV